MVENPILNYMVLHLSLDWLRCELVAAYDLQTGSHSRSILTIHAVSYPKDWGNVKSLIIEPGYWVYWCVGVLCYWLLRYCLSSHEAFEALIGCILGATTSCRLYILRRRQPTLRLGHKFSALTQRMLYQYRCIRSWILLTYVLTLSGKNRRSLWLLRQCTGLTMYSCCCSYQKCAKRLFWAQTSFTRQLRRLFALLNLLYSLLHCCIWCSQFSHSLLLSRLRSTFSCTRRQSVKTLALYQFFLGWIGRHLGYDEEQGFLEIWGTSDAGYLG